MDLHIVEEIAKKSRVQEAYGCGVCRLGTEIVDMMKCKPWPAVYRIEMFKTDIGGEDSDYLECPAITCKNVLQTVEFQV